jgi:hypothetical protein
MSTNLGSLEAQRITKARQDDADRAVQQAHDGRILSTAQPRFFEAMANELSETVRGFNSTMGLEGESAVTFVSTNHEIYIGKKGRPFFLRKIMHFEQSNELLIRTQVIDGYQKRVDEQKWHFDVKQGELRLNNKSSVECAEQLFKGVPDTYR